VLQALQGHPEAVEIITENPDLTTREARTRMRDYRVGQGTQENWQVGETRRWFAQAVKHAQGAIQYGHPASAHLDPTIVRAALDNPDQTEAALRAGGRGLITLADEVKRALAPPTPPPMFDDAPGEATSD